MKDDRQVSLELIDDMKQREAPFGMPSLRDQINAHKKRKAMREIKQAVLILSLAVLGGWLLWQSAHAERGVLAEFTVSFGPSQGVPGFRLGYYDDQVMVGGGIQADGFWHVGPSIVERTGDVGWELGGAMTSHGLRPVAGAKVFVDDSFAYGATTFGTYHFVTVGVTTDETESSSYADKSSRGSSDGDSDDSTGGDAGGGDDGDTGNGDDGGDDNGGGSDDGNGGLDCKPGWGYGDKNHCHSGPPGLRR